MHPEVETVEELLAQEGLHQVQAPDDLHVLVPVTDLAHRAGQIRAELRGPGPREVGPAAGGHVLRDAVEERGDLVVLAALLVRPVGGEDVIRPPAEQEGVRALVRGTDLRPGDLVQQGRLPAAEREPHRVLVGAAGRLPDEVEGCEQLDVDEAHALLLLPGRSRDQLDNNVQLPKVAGVLLHHVEQHRSNVAASAPRHRGPGCPRSSSRCASTMLRLATPCLRS